MMMKFTKSFGSLVQNLPKSIVSLEHHHFPSLRPAYVQINTDQYKINLDFPKAKSQLEEITQLYDTFEFELQPEMSVSQFLEYVTSKVAELNGASVYSIDKIPISGITTLEQLFQEPCYLVTGRGDLFYIRRFQGYDLDDYSYLKKYFTKMEVPLLEKKILTSYLRRVDSLLEQNHKTTFFKNNSSSTVTLDHGSLVRIFLDSFLDMRNTQSDHEKEMYEQYYNLKQRYEELKKKRTEMLEIGKKQAKLQMFGGLMVLCGHFCFMGAGIYVYYDWNVMEPIGYFLNTGGVIYLSYQYFKLQGEWTHSRFSNYLINKNFNKLCQQFDYNPQEFEQLEKLIQEIQDRIKTNIVTNL